MTTSATLHDLLEAGDDQAPAIRASGVEPLTYAGFHTLVLRTIARLNELGIGRGDRVAIVLPNGPEMATAFCCMASAAASAPLNPGLSQRRIRILHVGYQDEGADRRSGQHVAGR